MRLVPAQRENCYDSWERGLGLPQRLGLAHDAPPAEQRHAAVATAARWAASAATSTGAKRPAARDLQHSLDSLLAELDADQA